MNEIIIAVLSFLGGSSAVLALVKIYQSRQDTANTVKLTSELELVKVRAELWGRISNLENELCKLRGDVDLWQARYYQIVAVSEQQAKIIEELQSQVDKLEAINATQTKTPPA